MYAVAKSIRTGKPLEDVFQDVASLIPTGWHYPEITRGRVRLGGVVYDSEPFQETPWKLTSDIVVRGSQHGTVEAYHLEERPPEDEGPFLSEERDLLDGIAHALSETIERKQAEEHLRHAQKMEAVGQLASGVAHDFNNLLTAITGYAELARRALPAEHKAIKLLRGVEEAAEHATGVTRSLLTFSHKLETYKEPVELRQSVGKSMDLLRQVLPARIDLLVDLADDPIWVSADATQLQQVVMNLAINARDAMPEGGTLTISVSRCPAGSSDPQTGGPANATDVRLEVSDSGTGIDPGIQDRIFEPFFTTKPKGQGTGLGLAIIYGIVDDLSGHIDVRSQLGKGTTFTVDLPQIEPEESPGQPAQPAVPRHGQGEMVLVAEDNQYVLSIIATALQSFDYRVIRASDGEALLDEFQRHGSRIQLIVVDFDLPKRNGLECLQEIRARGAQTPAIVTTATVNVDLEDRLDQYTVLLRKPFQVANLSALATSILAAKGRRESCP